jgi:hypothetical protein
MDIPYCEEMKVLGLHIQNNIQATAKKKELEYDDHKD